MLELALAAVAEADEVVVVGEQVRTARSVRWVREAPAGGGPAAGVLAGLDALRVAAGLLVVLACDMPRVTVATLHRLTGALGTDGEAEGAVLLDVAGRRQPLAAAYRPAALHRARPASREQEHGLSMRALVGSLRILEVPAIGDEASDVDTWADLRRLDRRPPRPR
jgi:molybdopterin-guanine dinucleotide biosynthesis protein A